MEDTKQDGGAGLSGSGVMAPVPTRTKYWKGFLAWLAWLSPGKEKRASEVLLDWPYRDSTFMTPEVVWSSYVHGHRMLQLRELELQQCAKRLHEQRAEIRRLQAEVDRLRHNSEVTG